MSVWREFKNQGIPDELIDRLEKAYLELKESFYLGKHKPAELEGGHFAELVLRILKWAMGGVSGQAYTPLGKQLTRVDLEVKRLEGLAGTYSKSIRVHIPRVVLSMYDIRNGRGVGHPSGEVDPNLADATFVATAADWVLAEMIWIYHALSLNEAQAIVDGLVQRKAPLVQMFGDFPRCFALTSANRRRH